MFLYHIFNILPQPILRPNSILLIHLFEIFLHRIQRNLRMRSFVRQKTLPGIQPRGFFVGDDFLRFTVLLVDLLYVIVHQAGDSHFAAAFVAESSRDLKSIFLFPDGLVDFDFLQGVVCFSAAFCAEVSLVFHGGTLPSGFTFFFIIVSLPLFFVNNKAADSLPLAESISGFHESSNPLDTKNRHPLFSECRFFYPIVRLIFGVSGVSLA